MNAASPRVVIIGGGPGGYEAALVAAAAGASVTLVESHGGGGAAVLWDCVPSKALISAVAGSAANTSQPRAMAQQDAPMHALAQVNTRIMRLAQAQSADIEQGLCNAGVTLIHGRASLAGPDIVEVVSSDGGATQRLRADVVLLATGAAPRLLPSAVPDGRAILTWQDIYRLPEVPEHLIVVGSGVTGAELAQAFLGFGAAVTLVSSREQVLPGEDPDAAQVIQEVCAAAGMTILPRARMAAVRRSGSGVVVALEDGRQIAGSHALLAVGSVPNTAELGLAQAGVRCSQSGHIVVDQVSRTSVRGIYAAGDCTGALPLASVAAMQGRIAMAHALGDAVHPLELKAVSATIFTDPEIATVGISHADVCSPKATGALATARQIRLPLATNARAKMMGSTDGFVKLFADAGSRTVLGGVIVAPKASELIFPVALAVVNRLTLEQVADTITVYPSLAGSIAEAARRLNSAPG